MQHGNCPPSGNFEWFRRGDSSGEQTSPGIERSIRPGTAAPSTILVAEMGDGSMLLGGWRDGPSAYLCRADAIPLKRELTRAFGTPELTQRSSQGERR